MTFEQMTRIWAGNARLIHDFLREHQNDHPRRHLLVRYEDLVQNFRSELEKVLDFVGLDKDRYDFHAAENAPVRGSSILRADQGKVHWDPVQKSADFNPLERFRHWDAAKHRRFNWLAGAELRQLGYQEQPASGRLGGMWDRALDMKWGLKEWLRQIGWSLRNRLGLIKR
jgi:hypothetical protein